MRLTNKKIEELRDLCAPIMNYLKAEGLTMGINWDQITIEDCLTMLQLKNTATIINDGHVAGFEPA